MLFRSVRDTAQRMKTQKKAKAATSCKIASSSRSGFGLVLVMGLGFRRLKMCVGEPHPSVGLFEQKIKFVKLSGFNFKQVTHFYG